MKNRIATFVFFPIIAIVLHSCFAAKEYSRPEVVESDYFRTDSIPSDSLSMAAFSWRDMFSDTFLITHIEEGLQSNIDIRVAIEQMNIAQAYYKQAKWGQIPDLNARAQVTYQELADNSQFGAFFSGGLTSYELSGTLSWEADIWGKIRSRKRASEASYLGSVAAHKAVKTRLISQIASLYFQLLSLDEQKRVTEETIENRESSLETTRALKEAGTVTQVAVSQTEAQLQNARALLVEVEKNIKLTENTLSVLLGEAPGHIERGNLDDQLVPSDRIAIGYPVQLLRNRPDVIAAEYNLINAFELTNVARSNFYPSLSLSATGGLQSLDIDELFSVSSLFANVVGSLTQPIWNGRQIRSEYEASLSRQEIAYLNFRQAVLTASQEVSDALYSYRAADEKIDIRRAEYEANQMAAEDSQALLNSGFANYLEVLTARQNALNSRLQLINARMDRITAVVNLYEALGGGWQ